ncbi:acyl-CoA synthetase [Nocardioides sp. YIM 152588]|uniref:acyl-CoA synthetase n=1 Tax=Nocardioides sp. YIM 152588 TaxID=3158259 RepID=UPI0032E4A763
MPELNHGFNLATVFQAVAEALPDHEAIVWRDRRLSYADVMRRSTGLARYLVSRGLGVHRERDGLGGHESGQDHVGLYLLNGNEYVEGMVAGSLARVAPFNVNYRYVEEELLYLLRDAQTTGLIYHARFAPQVEKVRAQLPGLRVLVQVADASGNPLLEGAVDYDEALGTAEPEGGMPEPSGDDLFLLYTGGTTGMPKGVLWRQHDVYVSSMGGTPFGADKPFADYDELVAAARESAAGGGRAMLMLPPFMHAAATWSAYWTFTAGGRVVIPDVVDRLDAASALEACQREACNTFSVVGDAVARPIVEEIERGDYDLSSVIAVNNGGAPLSPTIRDRVLAAMPAIFLLDGAGSSETGMQMTSVSAAGGPSETGVFQPGPETTVLDDLRTRRLEPGEGGGWLARTGHIPLGYLGDADKTARTFPVVAGQRWSVPGDRAGLLDDGRIQLLGRDSITINSGGEKIFAEEVERALAAHPAVTDVMVVGRPSERWGSEVVAIVSVADGADPSDEELIAEAARHIARYKLPKAVVRVGMLQRSPSGKADYRWAKDVAHAAAPAEPAIG